MQGYKYFENMYYFLTLISDVSDNVIRTALFSNRVINIQTTTALFVTVIKDLPVWITSAASFVTSVGAPAGKRVSEVATGGWVEVDVGVLVLRVLNASTFSQVSFDKGRFGDASV